MGTSTTTRRASTAGTSGHDHNAYLEAIGKIFFHVYASEAVRPFDAPELRELLAQSRQNNAALGVSGMLLYRDGNFLQVLEGREATVRELIRKIYRDPRHRGVATLSEGFEDEYQFPDWSMGFFDLESEEAKAVPGYSEFLESNFEPKAFASDLTAAQRLLSCFKENS